MFKNNNITKLLGVTYPIVQAPMLGVTTSEMVAAAFKAGCLGSLPLGDLSADKCEQIIQQTKKLTKENFAVNIFAHQIPPVTEKLKNDYIITSYYITKYAEDNGLTVNVPKLSDLVINSYHEQIDVLLAEKCKILSFTFGNLDLNSIIKLKNNGVLLIGTCTSVAEAIQLKQSGVDIICVQGLEAGGHRGSFATENIPQIGGFSLLSQVREAVSSPLIYGGGLSTARSLQAAKSLGADAFQVGSLLLASVESALIDVEKERLDAVKEDDIILTKSFSGRYARGMKNTFTQLMDTSNNILPFPYQNKLTAEMRRIAKQHKNTDFLNLWVGQSILAYSRQSTTAILSNLIDEIKQIPQGFN